MKNKSAIFSVLHVGVMLLFLFSCKKEESATIPNVTIESITNIRSNSANSWSEITSDGGAEVTERGVCWSTNRNPSTTGNKTNDWSGLGRFMSAINGLTANATYYVRAFAINAAGTAYSNEISFSTTSGLPILTTTLASSITFKSAISGGNIASDGDESVYKRGICWSTSPSPTINNDKTDEGSGVGSFTSSAILLKPLTTYYIRAYATNSKGTAYGNEITITTLDDAPILTYKTTIQYNSNWNKTEEVKYKWDLDAKVWENFSKTTYSYDSNRHITQSIYSKWDGSTKNWINYSKATFVLFAYGVMWEGTDYLWETTNGNWVERSKYDNYSVNTNNKVLFLTSYQWSTYYYSWKEENKYMYNFTFDSNGRIYKETRTAYSADLYGYYGSKSTVYYTYDSKGNIIDTDSPDGGYEYVTTLTYGSNGNPTEKLTKKWDSQVNEFFNFRKLVYTYDSNGNQMEYIEYSF